VTTAHFPSLLTPENQPLTVLFSQEGTLGLARAKVKLEDQKG